MPFPLAREGVPGRRLPFIPMSSAPHIRKRRRIAACLAAHALLAAFVCVVVLVPDGHAVAGPAPLLVAAALAELAYLLCLGRAIRRGTPSAASAITIMVWALAISWELATAKLGLLSAMLFPAPQNVFDVFARYPFELSMNALCSAELLVAGFLGGVFLGAAAGIVVGWFAPLRRFFHPIAKVLAPIPPMVAAPYVTLVMPTFRAASVVLVGMTIFMFVLLETIERVSNIDREILDSARMLGLNGPSMVAGVLVPYVAPAVVGGLKLYLIMGFMMLIYGETMGSTYGLGHWICINHVSANYANLIAGFVEIGVLVVVANKLVELAQGRLIRWR